MPTLPALRGPSRPQHVFHRGGVSLPEAATVSLPFLSDLPASQRAGQGFGPSLWRALLGQDGAWLPLRLPSQRCQESLAGAAPGSSPAPQTVPSLKVGPLISKTPYLLNPHRFFREPDHQTAFCGHSTLAPEVATSTLWIFK